MGVLKSLWATVQGDPVFLRRVNGWFTLVWVAMIPISYGLGWLNSVVYVSAETTVSLMKNAMSMLSVDTTGSVVHAIEEHLGADLEASARVKRGQRLIEQQQAGIRGQGTRQFEHLEAGEGPFLADVFLGVD